MKKEGKTLHLKKIVFATIMGAMGNALALVTIVPTLIKQVALDFSLIPVYIVAIFSGPMMGGLTGIIAGIIPSIIFGPLGSLGILGFSTSIGKAIVGVTMGYLCKKIKPLERKTWIFIPLVIISFIPEAIWIIIVFSILVPLFIPSAPAFLIGLWASILIKASFEILVMAFFISALAGHEGFKKFIHSYIT